MKITSKTVTVAAVLTLSGVMMAAFQNCSAKSGAGGGDSTGAAVANSDVAATPTPVATATPVPTATPVATIPTIYILASNASGMFAFPGSATPVPISIIEKVNPTSMVRSQLIDLGSTTPTAMAIDAVRKRAYTNGGASSSILVYDTESGVKVNALGVTAVRGLVMSADYKALFASTYSGYTAIDLGTGASSSLAKSSANDQSLGSALSPDGKMLASLVYAGDVYLELIDVSNLADMKLSARIAITSNGAVNGNCSAMPSAVAFGPTGRILLSDNNCNALYQVDIATKTQVPTFDVNLGRDGYGTPAVVVYDPVTSLALKTKYTAADNSTVAPQVALVDPVAVSFSLSAMPVMPTQIPSAVVLLPDSTVLLGLGNSSAVLAKYNLKTKTGGSTGYTVSTPGLTIKSLIYTP